MQTRNAHENYDFYMDTIPKQENFPVREFLKQKL